MTSPSTPGGGRPAIRRATAGLAIAIVIGGGVLLGALIVGTAPGGTATGATPSPGTSAPAVVPTPATPAPPTPTPLPTLPPPPSLVASALTGLLVAPDAALRHPIAVMIDDQVDARPQSGFNAASIVWQAPAEGGIPRYMLIFQDQIPAGVGPIRSSRQYFIEWAAEWRAMYVHVGGSPQALATLLRYGQGQYVWNADGFRWAGTYMWRVHGDRFAPHNVFTDGEHLRNLAARIGAKDGPLTPAWAFDDGAGLLSRPVGTRITVVYPYEAIQYRYDARTNTYRRYIRAPLGGAFKLQVDAADGQPVAPKNVVVLRMAFGPLNLGHPDPHHRLEARDVGHGVAWISTNGVTVKGTWRKASITAPTLLFGSDGQPITFTSGQTFVQVMKLEDGVTLKAGVVPPPPLPKPLSLLPI